MTASAPLTSESPRPRLHLCLYRLTLCFVPSIFRHIWPWISLPTRLGISQNCQRSSRALPRGRRRRSRHHSLGGYECWVSTILRMSSFVFFIRTFARFFSSAILYSTLHHRLPLDIEHRHAPALLNSRQQRLKSSLPSRVCAGRSSPNPSFPSRQNTTASGHAIATRRPTVDRPHGALSDFQERTLAS